MPLVLRYCFPLILSLLPQNQREHSPAWLCRTKTTTRVVVGTPCYGRFRQGDGHSRDNPQPLCYYTLLEHYGHIGFTHTFYTSPFTFSTLVFTPHFYCLLYMIPSDTVPRKAAIPPCFLNAFIIASCSCIHATPRYS